MIEFSDVSYVYGQNTPFERAAVQHISFTVPDGMTTGIIGHTGSGKSTIAQMMNALLTPTEGVVRLDGENINASAKIRYATRFRVGIVFQYPEYQLFEETVEKDIAYGPSNMGLSPEEIKKRVETAAEFAGLPKNLLSASPFELSGGQKRRVAIAGVMAMQPKVLVLDEPAAGLDPRGRREIFERLSEYRKAQNSTLVIISHSMEDAAEYSDRILALRDGKILCEGTREEVFSRSSLLESSGLALPQVTAVCDAVKRECIKRGIPESALSELSGLYTVRDAERVFEKLLARKKSNGKGEN